MRRNRKITLIVLAILFLAILATTTYLIQQLIQDYSENKVQVITINKEDKLVNNKAEQTLHVLTAYSETH